MRILVTGANGITGHAVIRHMIAHGAEVTGLVSRDASAATIETLGANAAIGDLRDTRAVRQAMAGTERVYHICPAWVADETEIGEAVIAAAEASGVELFGYHSVLAPHLEEVPSHWAKMQVQMALMRSKVPFSVIQPAAYMQNLALALGGLTGGSALAVPHRTDAPVSWVDVEDVGEAVAVLMTRPDQRGGTYELCGTEAPLSAVDVAERLSIALIELFETIDVRSCPVAEFLQQSYANGLDAGQLARAEAFYQFMDGFGMRAGNTKVLTMLLGRPPGTWEALARRLLRES